MNRNVKTALIIGGVIIAILVIFSVIPGLLGWGYGYGMMGGFGGLMVIPMILVWGLFIWGIVWLVRNVGSSGSSSSSKQESAMEILKKRYARGEITKQEYEDMKKDLT